MDKSGFNSIYAEAVRVQQVSHIISEFGFQDLLSETQVEQLVNAIIWSEIDLYRDQSEWIPDLLKTVNWFLSLLKSSLVQADWISMLSIAIQRQGNRLSWVVDDDGEGESWKSRSPE